MKYIIELNIVKDDPWIVRCNSLKEVKDYFERNPEHNKRNTIIYKQVNLKECLDENSNNKTI